MSEQTSSVGWTPPTNIEHMYNKAAGGLFGALNAATAGARSQREVDTGSASLQLYSLGTPNGRKVSILLEELGIDYDAHVINLLKEEQFTSGFVAINPNSKIPALVDKEGPDGAPIHLFESASIMIYLAEKYGRFLPTDTRLKAETMNWLFWQMAGLGPMCGNFGHFFVYAPQNKLEARDYGVARYGMEVQRLLSVLDQHLEGRSYLVGEELTIADFAVFPWVQALSLAFKHPSGVDGFEFLSVSKYVNVLTWYESIVQRPAVQRGIIVCTDGVSKPWLNSK